jgi:predicted DNA-binding transcriptional regulator AlpA
MRFSSYPELESKWGIRGHQSTIWRKEKANKFPKRSRFGSIRYGWPDHVIDAYAAAIAAGHSEEDATVVAERLRPAVPQAA